MLLAVSIHAQVVIAGVRTNRMDALADGSICFFDRISKVNDKNVKSIDELNRYVHPRTSIELTIDRSQALTWDMKYFVMKGTCT